MATAMADIIDVWGFVLDPLSSAEPARSREGLEPAQLISLWAYSISHINALN